MATGVGIGCGVKHLRGQSAPIIVASGLMALYKCDEGSGTTLNDTSGNALHGTFGGTPLTNPTWAGGGVRFNGGQAITLPVGLTIANIKFVHAFVSCDVSQTTSFPVVAASNTSPGIGWGVRPSIYPWDNFLQLPQIFGGGVDGKTRSYTPHYQPQVLGYYTGATAGSDNDRLYVDNDEVVRYATQSQCAAVGRVGQVFLGGSPYLSSALQGTLYGIAFYNRQLGLDEIAQNVAYFKNAAAVRGASPMGFINGSATRVLVCDGDSITHGTIGGTTGWVDAMTLAQTWTRWNFGIDSQTVAMIQAANRQRCLPLWAKAAPVNAYVIMAGTNDIAGTNTALVAPAFALLQQAVNQALAAGFKVIVVPMIDRTNSAANKNSYNALIAAGPWPAGVSLVSPSAMPNLCPDAASANLTYFQADAIHPTQTGYADINSALTAAINALG